MNIVAFILALAGAGLSLFQPIISGPFMELRVSDFFSASSSELTTAAYFVLVVAVIAVACGIGALTRKGKELCVTVLIICGFLYLISAGMFTGPSNRNEFTSAMSGMAMSVWMKTVLVWALCYIGAGICTLLDKPEASTAISESASTTASSSTSSTAQSLSSNVQSSSNAHKTFEPILGVETPALIKRAYLFLSESDFDEADRYFEQAVRQDPENSSAYLGKLLVKLRLQNTDELCSIKTPLTEYKFFQYAMRFASEDEKSELQKYLDANTTHIENVKQERQQQLKEEKRKQEEEKRKLELKELNKKYDEAVRVSHSGEENHDSKALYRAAGIFDELGDFKYSKILAESAREKAAKEQGNSNVINGLMFIFIFIAIVVIIALNYR